MLNLPFPLQPAPWKEQLEREDRANQKKDSDYLIGSTLSGSRRSRLILLDPDGKRWIVKVDTSGTLSTEPFV